MLRHSKQDLQMCRKGTGTSLGYVCAHHEGRCVICDYQFDDILPTMRVVHVCDDCGLVAEGEERCIMCGVARVTELAYYCPYCVALERDRDGCPRVVNQSRQQRLGMVRTSIAH